MVDNINNLLFGYYPYMAGTVFLLGSLVRFDLSQYTWRTGSSQLLHSNTTFRYAMNAFHIGIILLFFGHFFGLLTPPAIYHAFGISTGVKQAASMVAGGVFGLLCLLGITYLLYRRLFIPRVRANSAFMDTFVIILLYIQLLLGIGTIWVSTGHMDGSMMLMMTEWAQRIVTFRGGAAQALAGAHWYYKLHIFIGVTIFLVFPFTRLVHIWSVPYAYIARSYQVVRRRHT